MSIIGPYSPRKEPKQKYIIEGYQLTDGEDEFSALDGTGMEFEQSYHTLYKLLAHLHNSFQEMKYLNYQELKHYSELHQYFYLDLPNQILF